MPAPTDKDYNFAGFSLDVDRCAVLRAGESVRLRRQSFDVLMYLVERQGALVTKDELHAAIWGDTPVTENSLTQCLAEIRKALGDNEHRIVRTIVRRGYLFDALAAAAHEAVAKRGPRRIIAITSAVVGGIAVLLVVVAFLSKDEGENPPSVVAAKSGKPSIALMEFENLGDNPENQPFVDGVREEIATQLGHIDGLRLVSNRTATALSDDSMPMSEIAAALGADYVITGSAQRSNEKLRLNAQLFEAESDAQIWAETYNVALTVSNLLDAEHEVAVAVASMLGIKTLPDHYISVSSGGPTNMEALDLFYNGLHYMRLIEHQRQPGPADRNFHSAIGRLEASIAADPDWAPPHFALGRLMHIWGSLRSQRGQALYASRYAAAQRHLERALEIDAEYTPALSSLAFVQMAWIRDFQAARQTYQRLRAAGGMSYWINGMYLLHAGRYDEAADEFLAQFEMSPEVHGLKYRAAYAMACAGRYSEAIQHVEDLKQLDWLRPRALWLQAWAYLKLDERDKGIEIAENIALILGDLPVAAHFALAGMSGRARAALQAIDDPADPGSWYSYQAALALGDHELALDYLESSVEIFDPGQRIARCDTSAPLDDNPRFRRLLREIGLPK